MKSYAETIDTTPHLDDLERRQALAALLDELETLGTIVAALRPDEDPVDAAASLWRLASHPLLTEPAAHAAVKRVWGRLSMASRRHARVLACYIVGRPAAPLAPGVPPGVLTLTTLLVLLYACRRLLLPVPVVWWPPLLEEDAAAIGRLLPAPAIAPPPTDPQAEPPLRSA